MNFDIRPLLKHLAYALAFLLCGILLWILGTRVLETIEPEHINKTALYVELGLMAAVALFAILVAVVMAPETVPFAFKTVIGFIGLGWRSVRGTTTTLDAGSPTAPVPDEKRVERRAQTPRETVHRAAISTGMMARLLKPGDPTTSDDDEPTR